MTEAVGLMTGVVAYSFEWRDLAPTPDTLRFVAAARHSLRNLRKLSLNAQIVNFSGLLGSSGEFWDLDELELTFDYDAENWETGAILRRTIASFVNHMKSLRTLGMSSASKADVSPLFHAFEPIPSLRRLAIVSSAFEHPREPDALLSFLTRQPDLRDVEIVRLAAIAERAYQAVNAWLKFCSDLAKSSAPANLQRLVLAPLTTPDNSISVTQRSAGTLARLVLLDTFLSPTELQQILFPQLQKLHVGIRSLTLSICIFDLFVKHTTSLQTLYLVLPDGGVDDAFTRFPGDATALDALARGWPLRDIGIWEKRFVFGEMLRSSAQPPATEAERNLQEAVAGWIQSVKFVRGRAMAA